MDIIYPDSYKENNTCSLLCFEVQPFLNGFRWLNEMSQTSNTSIYVYE